MLYRVAGFLQCIAGLSPKDKIAGVFGSYGWSSGATKQMAARLAEIGMELPETELTCKYRPLPEDLQAAREWGAAFGDLVKAKGLSGK